MNRFLIIIAIALASCFVNAKSEFSETSDLDKEVISKLVDQFYLKNAEAKPSPFMSLITQSKSMVDHETPNCPEPEPEPGKSCMTAVCEKMPEYKCDDRSEINQVLKICRGVDGACIDNICSKMPDYKCDDLSEHREVAKLCRKVHYSDCINAVCNRMPDYKCDDLSELKSVAQICTDRVDPDCINSVCDRMPSYKCDDLSELRSVAKSCSGSEDL